MIPSLTTSQFTQPEYHLAGADATTVGALIATASDLAIVVGQDGVVQDFAISTDGLAQDQVAHWLGKPMEACVTIESRGKVREMLRAATAGEAPRWREINHPTAGGGSDLPMRYCAMRTDSDGRIMLLGRDLSGIAVLQRRLISVQQSMEQDYSRLLHMETRYRLLFQSATEAFLIVDAASGRILEANGAAVDLFGYAEDQLTRKRFPLGLDEAGTQAVLSALSTVRTSGRATTVTVRSADGATEIDAFVSLFRADESRHFLVRLKAQLPGSTATPNGEVQLVALCRRASEAIVLTDEEGRIEWANDAFLDLSQLSVEDQAKGEPLDRFFTRQGIDLPMILSNARKSGRLRFFATSLTGVYGAVSEVEVSTVTLPGVSKSGYGFVMRNVALRPVAQPMGDGPLPHSAQQLTDLIGRVPLKDLVRETVDVIERLCIESALKMTGDNRASAADLLGLSRQSLYVKLRRYGLGEIEGEGEPIE